MLYIVCCLLITTYVAYITSLHITHTGGQYSLPYNSPFSMGADFFQRQPEHCSVIVKEADTSLMKKCLPGKITYVVPESPDKNLMKLDTHMVDFLVTSEFDIAPFIKKNTNIRFVCGLHSPVVSMLAPDRSNIDDLNSNMKNITIAIKNIQSRRCLYDILSAYENTDHIKIVVQSEKDILEHYGDKYDIYFDVTVHPNKFFKSLTEKIPSHMVTMSKINAGGYFVLLSEAPFYKQYPYYKKSMIDTVSLIQSYPKISPPVDNNLGSLYIPTLKSHLVLLTHKDVSNEVIRSVLRKIIFQLHSNSLFKGITPAEIGQIGVILPYHKGTDKIYRQLQLLSTGNEQNYYMIS